MLLHKVLGYLLLCDKVTIVTGPLGFTVLFCLSQRATVLKILCYTCARSYVCKPQNPTCSNKLASIVVRHHHHVIGPHYKDEARMKPSMKDPMHHHVDEAHLMLLFNYEYPFRGNNKTSVGDKHRDME